MNPKSQHSRGMFCRPRPWILTVSLISIGCATRPAEEPEWPRQPSPSYPDGTKAQSTSSEEEPTTPAAPPNSPAGSPDSTLAKQYDGKEALDTLEGKATYYADSLAGNHTANGDIYRPSAFTAAHKKLPFGTVVRVVRMDTNAKTYVKINDRGPFGPSDRIIDLSKAAAKELNMLKAGVVKVRVEIVERPSKK